MTKQKEVPEAKKQKVEGNPARLGTMRGDKGSSNSTSDERQRDLILKPGVEIQYADVL